MHCLPAEANLLFGRGFRAGIDRREQKKTAAESEADMQKRLRDQLGACTAAAGSGAASAAAAGVGA